MKKLGLGLAAFCMAIMLCACSSGNNTEKTQEKIDNTGWTIDLQRDAGTAVDYLDLIVNDHESYSFTRMKESDSIDYVEYRNGSENDTYVISYNKDTKEETLIHAMKHLGDTETTCLGYSLTKNSADATFGSQGNCSKQELNKFDEVKKTRDLELDNSDLTLSELYDWAVWYYKNN